MEENIVKKHQVCSTALQSQNCIPQHLIEWILCMTQKQDEISDQPKTLSNSYSTEVILKILEKINPEYFSASMSQIQMKKTLVEYFYRVFGFYVNSFINTNNHKENITLLVLYASLYCENKQYFVQKILTLSNQTQTKLVCEIQSHQIKLKQLRNWDKMIEEIRKLQIQNNQLKSLLTLCHQQCQKYIKCVQNLKEELQETKKQRNVLVLQKRKILSQFQLSSLAEYEDLSLKLYQQNELYAGEKKQLNKIIIQYQRQIEQLKEDRKHSDKVIVELDGDNKILQKRIQQLRQQLEKFQHKSSQITLSCYSKGSKIEQSTQDMTFKSTINDMSKNCGENILPSTITDMRSNNFAIEQQLFLCSNSSNFSKKTKYTPRESGRGSAWNMFHTVKQNVLLVEKTRNLEQQMEILQLKIIQLQNQISMWGRKQKFYLRKNRKIQVLYDQFKQQHDKPNSRNSSHCESQLLLLSQ